LKLQRIAYTYDDNNRLTEETKNAGQSSATTHYSYDNNGNTICKTVEAAGNMGAAEGEASNSEYMPGTASLAIQGQTTEVDISAIGAAEEITSVGTASIETGFPETSTAASPEITLETTTEQALSLEAQVPGTGESNSNNTVNNEDSITINEYNGLNQLIKVTEGNNTYSYTYNWDGLRASKTINGVTTNHIWDSDQMVLETDAAGNVTNKYIRGINLIYSGEGANRRYFLYNGHGDTVQLTGTTGSSIKAYDYDAFGVEKNIDPEDTNLFRYCGEYFDKETGTIYLRARYYDPEIGRFISEDSYWGEDADPLSLNLYTYCGNNPINYIDPSGHWTLSQYDNLGSGMYARLKEEGINILQLNPVSMLMNSYKQWKALLNNDITVAEVYAAGFESIISDYKYVLDGKNNFVKAYMPLKSGASDKEVYNAGYHIAGIIIDLATAGVAVDDIVKAVRANRAIMKAEAIDFNKLNHIFGKEQHNLDGFLKSYNGNQVKAYQALERATQSYVKAHKITGNFKDIVVRVNGTNITVRGTIVDGKVKIGTAFIP